tara:strand:+ start:2816 stop:3520 length:705 start_codon:yes stop_codon:yes gene_type:complete
MSLPTIEMPKKEPEPIQQEPDKIHSEVEDDLHEITSLKDSEVKDELMIDDNDTEEDDIFDEPPPPKVEPINEFNNQPKGKRKYVRKAPMSDKQKDHLAKIRKIASEKRLKEREAKAQAKEDELVSKAEAKILAKKKKKEEAELQAEDEEEIITSKTQKTKSRTTPLSQNSFTKDDLDSAVLSAITSYDQLRKREKAEKKIQQKKDIEQEKMKRVIQQAIQPQTAPEDPWRQLFS